MAQLPGLTFFPDMPSFENSDQPQDHQEHIYTGDETDVIDPVKDAITCDTDDGKDDIEDGLPADYFDDEREPGSDVLDEARDHPFGEAGLMEAPPHMLPSSDQIVAEQEHHDQQREAQDITDRSYDTVQVRDRAPERQEAPRSSQHAYLLEGVDTHGLTPDEIDRQYREGAEARRDSISFDGERGLTPQEEDALEAYNEALINVGDEFGVNLRDRVTKPKHVHVFPKPDDYRNAAAKVSPGSEKARGVTEPSAGVLVVARFDPLDNLYGIGHEDTHDASFRWVTPHIEVGPDGVPRVDAAKSSVKVGYMNDGKPGTNEFTTDMLTHRALVDSGQGRITPGYGVGSLLLSGVVMDTATRLNRPGVPVTPQTVENELTKGMLTTERNGLQLVGRALGAPAVNMLLSTKGFLENAPTAYVAQQMGTDTAARDLWGREVGAPVRWFPWR